MVKTLSFCDKVFAKNDGKTTLDVHINDCLTVLDYLFSTYKEPIGTWCKKNNVDFNWLTKTTRNAVYFHDFGKATLKWQEEARKEKPNFPVHGPYSGYFLMQNLLQEKGGRNLNDPSEFIPLLAMISHHSILTENSWNNLPSPDRFCENYLIDLNNRFGYKEITFNHSFNSYVKILNKFRSDSAKTKFRDVWGNNKPINTSFKSIYSFILSLLITSDNMASAFEKNNIFNEKHQNYGLKNKFPDLNEINKKLNHLEDEKRLYDIQKDILKLGKAEKSPIRILLEAPCGEGKTMASLLYARELFKKSVINRVIFTLPTQVTTNNMLLDFKSEYGIPEQWIGVFHSEIMQFLKKMEKESSFCHDDSFSFKNLKYWSTFFGKQFNISTIDHLLEV